MQRNKLVEVPWRSSRWITIFPKFQAVYANGVSSPDISIGSGVCRCGWQKVPEGLESSARFRKVPDGSGAGPAAGCRRRLWKVPEGSGSRPSAGCRRRFRKIREGWEGSGRAWRVAVGDNTEA